MNKKAYEQHRRRVAEAEPIVDNKPPKFKVAAYYDKQKLRIDASRVREIDVENMKLLKRMNIITRLGGTIDCKLSDINYKPRSKDQAVNNKIIRKQNKVLLKGIRDISSYYSTAEFIKHWKDMKLKTMPTKRIDQDPAVAFAVPQTNEDICVANDVSIFRSMNPSIRIKCFFEIEIQADKQKLGRIQIELYNDIVPKTCENFVELCSGSNNGISYRNTPFHRIVTGYWCQGGDVTKFNGSGGTSIYGDSFENENYNLRHAGPGILSMCNDNNTSNSKFNLTFRPLETVDKKHVVFGKVVSGISNIYKIEEFGTKTGKPIKSIIISDCGVLSRKRK